MRVREDECQRGSIELSKNKMKQLEAKLKARQESIVKLESKMARMEKDSIKMRVGFLKQLQHLKEMAHRKETAANFTFLEVKFFSAEDGFDEDMTYLLNQRLQEARDQYNRRMIMLQKKNCEIKEKVEQFEQICADGNYGISFQEMGTESILRKLSIIENNPFVVWKSIEQYFGSGFFNDVILREYDIQTESSNEITTEMNYQLKEYQRKAKQHISSISKQTQIEIALLRKHLKDKEKEIQELRNKAEEISERVRTQERIQTDLKLKEQEQMLKEKFELEKEQIQQTIARKISSNSTTVSSSIEADKITLRMAMTRWWFKGKLITIKRHDKAEREAIIEQAENQLHKQEIHQMADLQTTILELRQESYRLNKNVAEANYEKNAMKRQFDRKSMELDQLEGQLHTMRMQYKDTLDERIQLQNTSASLLQSVDAQKAYIENMEKQMFDLQAWIKRACSVDKSLRPPKSLMSKSKQKQVADTLNKKAIKQLFDSSVRELKQLESDNTRDKECLTLIHGLDAELDLRSEQQKISLTVQTQTQIVYSVEESLQTSDQLLQALKSKIKTSENKLPSRQSSKQADLKGANELKQKHKKEIDRLKKEVENLKKILKDETQLRIETSRSRDSQHSERLKLEEMVKEKQRRNTENYTNKGIFTKLDIPVSHQSSQTILEEEEETDRKRIYSPDRSPPNQKQANATSQTEESVGEFEGQPIFEKQGKSKIVVNLTSKNECKCVELGLQEVTEREDSKNLSELSSPMEHVSSLLKAAEQEITVYEGSIEQSITDVKYHSQAVGDSIQQTIRTQQSPSDLMCRYGGSRESSPIPVPVAPVLTQTRINVSRKEQRPVFKVVPYNLEVFERFLERQKPELQERGIQTNVAGSLQKKLVVDKSGSSLVEEMMNQGLRKSIDLREISRNRNSKSKLSIQYQSNNTRSSKSIKTPLNRAVEDARLISPSPVESSPLNISNFLSAMTPDQQQLSPKMFMTPKTADSTNVIQSPLSSLRPDSGRGQNFITVSEHQKMVMRGSNSNLRSEGGTPAPRQSASYSLTNMSLQTISGEENKTPKQDYFEKRKQNQRRFNYHIKKSFMLQQKKQKSIGSSQEVKTLRERLKVKNKQFKTVIANEGRKFVIQDDQQPQQRAISSFSPAYMVPLYRNEGSTSVESTRDMLLLDSNRSTNSKRFHKTIKFESPPIVQPLQLSEGESEVQISVDRD